MDAKLVETIPGHFYNIYFQKTKGKKVEVFETTRKEADAVYRMALQDPDLTDVLWRVSRILNEDFSKIEDVYQKDGLPSLITWLDDMRYDIKRLIEDVEAEHERLEEEKDNQFYDQWREALNVA